MDAIVDRATVRTKTQRLLCSAVSYGVVMLVLATLSIWAFYELVACYYKWPAIYDQVKNSHFVEKQFIVDYCDSNFIDPNERFLRQRSNKCIEAYQHTQYPVWMTALGKFVDSEVDYHYHQGFFKRFIVSPMQGCYDNWICQSLFVMHVWEWRDIIKTCLVPLLSALAVAVFGLACRRTGVEAWASVDQWRQTRGDNTHLPFTSAGKDD